MTTWEDVLQYARACWPITGEADGFLAIEFAVGDGRTQMTGVRLMPGGSEQRVRLETQLGWAGDVDPQAALKMNAVLPLGALAVDEDDRLLYAHSMMLGTLDVDALDTALRTLAYYGDRIERQQSIQDRY